MSSLSPSERHHMAWDTTVHSYLSIFDNAYDLYHNDASFHSAVYLGAEVVSGLLGLHPLGPPLTPLDHTTRRLAMTSQAALVEHRGQMDIDTLLAEGWTLAPEEEHVFGKRLRWLIPPADLVVGT